MFVVSGSTYQQNNNEAGNEGRNIASSNHLFQDNFRIYVLCTRGVFKQYLFLDTVCMNESLRQRALQEFWKGRSR